MRSARARLLGILDAISDIDRFLPASQSDLERDERTLVGVLHQLQVIGTRNVLVHG